jgi:hypothetical protein
VNGEVPPVIFADALPLGVVQTALTGVILTLKLPEDVTENVCILLHPFESVIMQE